MRTFTLTDEQEIEFKEWAKTKPVSRDTLGTQFEFCFTPTSLGTALTVRCLITNTELNLTDYDSW